jgi:hypothetical protein
LVSLRQRHGKAVPAEDLVVKMKAWAAFLVLATALAIPAASQDIPTMRIMVSLEAAGSEGEADLRSSLEAALAASPLAAVVRGYRGDPDGLAASAGMASCPLALSVAAKDSAEGLEVSWRFLSPAAGGIELHSGSFEKARPGARDLASSFWTEIVQDLGPAIEVLPKDRVTLVAPPGARIEGFGEALTMPPEGELEIGIALPAFVRWKASSPSHSDASGSLLVVEPGARLELPMSPLRRWSADLSLYGFSFLEARAARLLGKRFFARAALTQFLAGFSLEGNHGSSLEPKLFSSFSMIQAGAGIGSYYQDPDRTFRLYSSIDAFVRLSLPDSSVVVDPEIPLGLFPSLGLEWGFETRTKAFLEFGGVLYPLADIDYVRAIRDNQGGNMVITGEWWPSAKDGWFIEFPVTRLGLRIYF